LPFDGYKRLRGLLPGSLTKATKGKVWPVRRRKPGEPVDAAMLTNPVPSLNVVGVRVFGESCCLGLLRGEVALLLFGKIEQPARCFLTRLNHKHNTATILKYCAVLLRAANFPLRRTLQPTNRLGWYATMFSG
jgi:hypothetical protein